MSMILAATSPDEQLFWIVAPETPEKDGVLMRDGSIIYVPFWSYMSRSTELTPVRGSALLNELWVQNGDEAWVRKYVSREEPLSDEDLMSVEFLLVDVPDEVEPAQEFGSL